MSVHHAKIRCEFLDSCLCPNHADDFAARGFDNDWGRSWAEHIRCGSYTKHGIASTLIFFLMILHKKNQIYVLYIIFVNVFITMVAIFWSNSAEWEKVVNTYKNSMDKIVIYSIVFIISNLLMTISVFVKRHTA